MFQWYKSYQQRSEHLKQSTALIQKQVNNVSKLVVTEGHFSQVFNYEQSEKIFANLLTTKKRALVVVNAEVSIAYDLSKVSFEVDQEKKTLYITKIPEAEVKISPDIEYYNTSGDYLNPFDAEDINKIKREVTSKIAQKVEDSGLKENAQNRLLTEMSKFYVLTNSLGWTLVYNETPVTNDDYLKSLDFKG
jgi:ribosome-binding ATPase YchF (GTP1/OBG family)